MTDPFTIHRCTECGAVRRSIGALHAHIDARHRGWGPFNLLPPVWPTYGHVPTLMESTEIIDVFDYEDVTPPPGELGHLGDG